MVAYNRLTFQVEDPTDRRFSGPGVRLETIQRHLEREFEQAIQHLPLERVKAYIDSELRRAAERREELTSAPAAERRATKGKQRSDRKRKR